MPLTSFLSSLLVLNSNEGNRMGFSNGICLGWIIWETVLLHTHQVSVEYILLLRGTYSSGPFSRLSQVSVMFCQFTYCMSETEECYGFNHFKSNTRWIVLVTAVLNVVMYCLESNTPLEPMFFKWAFLHAGNRSYCWVDVHRTRWALSILVFTVSIIYQGGRFYEHWEHKQGTRVMLNMRRLYFRGSNSTGTRIENSLFSTAEFWTGEVSSSGC